MLENIVSAIGRFSYKYSKIIAGLGALLLVAVFILQSMTVIEYSYAEESIVTDIFPQDDTLVIVYNNYDEEKIAKIIEILEKDERVSSIQAYANTLGLEMTPLELSEMLGIDVVFLNTLFYIYENGMLAEGMTFPEFVSFITSDSFLENEMFSSMIDEESKAQITQLSTLVEAISSGKRYYASEIADMFGVDENLVKIVFYVKQLMNMSSGNIFETILGTTASISGMNSQQINQLFGIRVIEKMRFTEFVDTINAVYPIISTILPAEQAGQIEGLISITDSIRNDTVLYPDDIAEMFGSMGSNDMLNNDTVTLLYIMSRSNTLDYSDTRIALFDFFMFISDKIISNESFSSFFDGDVAKQIEDAKVQMLDGKAQLIGPEHSRMVVYLSYIPESPEIQKFYDNLTKNLDSLMVKDYYLVGNSAMSYEVSQTFQNEFLIISIVTALVVFVVVFLTFKNALISLLLVGVIECAVFAMMGVMTIANDPIFFIALILVQCILMGTMIDYAILFATYYKEVRKTTPIKEALPTAMRKATYAILTSSLIMILVTFLCGFFMTGTVAAILQALSTGAFCAIILILFVLPSLLIIFDKWIIKEKFEDSIEANN